MSDSIIRFVTDEDLEIQVDWADLINIPANIQNLDCDACSLIEALSGSLQLTNDDISTLQSQIQQILLNQSNKVSFNVFDKHHHDCRYFTRNQLKIPGIGGEVHWNNLISVGHLADEINKIEIEQNFAQNVSEALSASAQLSNFLSPAEKQALLDNNLQLEDIEPSKDNPFITLEFITNNFINQGFAKEDHIHFVFNVGSTTDPTINRGSGRTTDVFGQAPDGPYDWSDILGHINYFVHRDQPEFGQNNIPNSELNWVDESVKGKKVWLGTKHIFTSGESIRVEDDAGGSKDITGNNLDLDNESIKIYKGLYVGENLNTDGVLVNFRQARFLTMGFTGTNPASQSSGFIIERDNTGNLEVNIDNFGAVANGNIFLATNQSRSVHIGRSGQDNNNAWRKLIINYDYPGTGITDAAVEIAGSLGIQGSIFLGSNATINNNAIINNDITVNNNAIINNDITVNENTLLVGQTNVAQNPGSNLYTGNNNVIDDSGSLMVRAWTANSNDTGFVHAWVRDFSTSSNFLTLRTNTAKLSGDGNFVNIYSDNDIKIIGDEFGPTSPMGTAKPNNTNISLENSSAPYNIYNEDFAYSGLRINSGIESLNPNFHDYQYMTFTASDHLNGSKLSGFAPSGANNFGWVMSDWFRTEGEILANDYQALHLVASKEYVDFQVSRFDIPGSGLKVDPRNLSPGGAGNNSILAFNSSSQEWQISNITGVLAASFFSFRSNPVATFANPIAIDLTGADVGKNVLAVYTDLSTNELWIEDAEDAGEGREIIIKFLIDELGEDNFPLRIRAVDSTIDGQLRFDVANLTAGIRFMAFSGNWVVI